MFVSLVSNCYNYPKKSYINPKREAWATWLGREGHVVQETVSILKYNCCYKEVHKLLWYQNSFGGLRFGMSLAASTPFAVLTPLPSLPCPGAGGTWSWGLRTPPPRASSLLWAVPVARNHCPALHFLGRRRSNGGKEAVLPTCMSHPSSAHPHWSLVKREATVGAGSALTPLASPAPLALSWDTLPVLALSCIMDLANVDAQIRTQIPATLGFILPSNRRE